MPLHRRNNQTWKLFTCVFPGLLVKEEAKARAHTGSLFWEVTSCDKVGTGKKGKPVLLLSRSCYQAGHLCEQLGLDPARSTLEEPEAKELVAGE